MPECHLSPVQYRKKDERFSVKRTVEITNLYFIQLIYYEIMTNNNGNVMIDIDENTSENKLNKFWCFFQCYSYVKPGVGKMIVGLCNCYLHHPP